MTTRLAVTAALCCAVAAGCSSGEAPPAAPSSTASASASATPSLMSPTPSPVPTVTPTWPLTGLPAASAAVVTGPALMVKVDNVGGAVPQSGLNSADLVIEEPVEGGLTRFVAVFHSQDPAVVGPVRSARPVDAELSRMLGGGGILAFSGASPYEIRPVKARSKAILVADDWGNAPAAFFRDRRRSGEHTLFAYPAKLRAWVTKKTQAPAAALAFSASTSASARPTSSVTMRFPDNRVGWEWDGRMWLRSQRGRDHTTTDAGRVSADTVIIVSVRTGVDPSIHDVLGNPTPVVDFEGTGTAWLLRDGTVTKATWSRPDIDAPLRILDASGAPVGAKPGRTWLEVLPRPATPSFTGS